MNLVVDSGNTRFKAALFEGTHLIRKENFYELSDLQKFIYEARPSNLIVSSVNHDPKLILSTADWTENKLVLSASMKLPIRIAYKTPQTLGVDRIAAACGALEMFPYENCLVIDAGTCITYDLLQSDGTFCGGAISPGIFMRIEAMHKFTKQLPLITLTPEFTYPLIGDSTETCLQSGVINGVKEEMKGMISQYECIYSDLKVILCGGDSAFFENRVKPAIFVAPDLVLYGLNRILRYHVEI